MKNLLEVIVKYVGMCVFKKINDSSTFKHCQNSNLFTYEFKYLITISSPIYTSLIYLRN